MTEATTSIADFSEQRYLYYTFGLTKRSLLWSMGDIQGNEVSYHFATRFRIAEFDLQDGSGFVHILVGVGYLEYGYSFALLPD